MTNTNTEEHQFTWHQKFFHQRDMMRKLMFIREFFIFIDVHSQTQQKQTDLECLHGMFGLNKNHSKNLKQSFVSQKTTTHFIGVKILFIHIANTTTTAITEFVLKEKRLSIPEETPQTLKQVITESWDLSFTHQIIFLELKAEKKKKD